jgi:hypothetical protein
MGKKIPLPFWDWSIDSQAPDLSPLLTPEAFGTGGDKQGCVVDGAFANWKNSDGSCLSRGYSNTTIGTLPSKDDISTAVSGSTNFDEIWHGIENDLHSRFHAGIGGDMRSYNAVRDPLFFLHHAFIDRIYQQWQVKSQGRFSEFPYDKSRDLCNLGYSAKQALELSKCYAYSGLKRKQSKNGNGIWLSRPVKNRYRSRVMK